MFCPRFFIGQAVPGASEGGISSPDFWPLTSKHGSVLDSSPELGSSPDLSGQEFELDAADAHHALKVLRLRKGELCEVVVGATVYAATLLPEESAVRVALLRRIEGPAAGPRYRTQVGIVQAVAKPALVDEMIEKGTEVGASFFLLSPSAGSPRGAQLVCQSRLARWQRIAREAAKQSKRLSVPGVFFCCSLAQAFERLRQAGVTSVVLQPDAERRLDELLWELDLSLERLALWIGPEGGWGKAELEDFASWGMRRARLGRSILRTETTGPVAVAVTRLTLNDW